MPPIALMRKWYKTPNHPTSFSGITKIKNFHKVNEETVNKVLEGIPSYSIHREVKKPRKRNPFFVYNKRDHVQADLIEVRQLSEDNDGVNYLLTAIDMFSKFAVIIPMKNKSQKASIKALKKMFETIKPKTLMTDSGGEFTGGNVKRFLRNENVKHYTPGSDIKCSGVERFNKTIQRKMYHHMTSKGTNRFIDVLPQLISSYNSSSHSRLMMSPNEAERPENDLQVKDMLNQHYLSFFEKRKNKRAKFKLGETVRVSKIKTPFFRSYKNQSNEELFEIIEVKQNLPIIMYKLKSLERLDVIRGAFYGSELTKINLKVFDIERELKRRNKNGVEQVLVKWVGYHNKFNSWIPVENLEDIVR